MGLTLAGMTVLEPSDTGVTDTAPELADECGGTVLGRSYRALSVGIVSVVLLIAFEATAVGTAMPVAARELGGVSLYAFAFSGYFTTSLFGMVFAGQWSDRRGPLGALTTGIGAFAAGLLVSGTAGVMWVFIAGRAVQGLGAGWSSSLCTLSSGGPIRSGCGPPSWPRSPRVGSCRPSWGRLPPVP